MWTSRDWSETLERKPSNSTRWSARPRRTSSASTGRWPTPSTTAADDGPEGGRARDASFWRKAGYLTSLGWLIALPIAIGVLLGRFVDDRLGSGSYWTLILLGAGIGVAVIEVALAVRAALGGDDRA